MRGTSVRTGGARDAESGATEAGAPAAVAQVPVAPAVTEPVEIVRSTHGRRKVKADSVLAARAAEEYVYVGQDLRRILIVALILFGALIAVWLVLTAVDPFGLY
ncbi:MAG: hypothetical protein ACKOTZ_03975 [Chloroflexota bacterium]